MDMQFCSLGVPEQVLGGIPLGFGIAVEDTPCTFTKTCYHSEWKMSVE